VALPFGFLFTLPICYRKNEANAREKEKVSVNISAISGFFISAVV
jgi:hypothetical protein